jgi:antitoxin HicB
MTLRYPIKLEEDDNGTVLATCPSLPEVTTFGEDIPPPPERRRGRSVALPLMTLLKASLYRALLESGITRAELMRAAPKRVAQLCQGLRE